MKKQERANSPINQKLADAMMSVLKIIHDPNHTGQVDPELLERQRKHQDILGKMVTPPLGFSWEPFDLNNLSMAWVRPERGHDSSRVILYCHGGGYTTGNLGYARVLAAKMASATGYEVLSFAYRLAPEHPWPAPQEDAMAAWDYLMHLGYGGDNVILAGDSAGGNMALVLAQSLRKAGRRMPRRIILFSPWTDMTSSGESYQRCEKADPMVSLPYIQAVRNAYAPGQDWSRPEFSPLFGDFAGFPPTLIQVGGLEVLYSDSAALHQRLQEASVPSVLECWPDMWHVFQMFPLRQSGEAMEKVADFLRI